MFVVHNNKTKVAPLYEVALSPDSPPASVIVVILNLQGQRWYDLIAREPVDLAIIEVLAHCTVLVYKLRIQVQE